MSCVHQWTTDDPSTSLCLRPPSPPHSSDSESETETALAETTRRRRRTTSTAMRGESPPSASVATPVTPAAPHWSLPTTISRAVLGPPPALSPSSDARSPNSTAASTATADRNRHTLRASNSAMCLRGDSVALPPSPNALAPIRDRAHSCVAEAAAPEAATKPAVPSGPASMPTPTRCLLPAALSLHQAGRSQSGAGADQQELALRSRSASAKTRRCGDMSPALSGSHPLSPLIVTRKQMAAMLSSQSGSMTGPVKAQEEVTPSWSPSVYRSLLSDQSGVPSSSSLTLPQISGSSGTPSSPARCLTSSPCDSRRSRSSIADHDSSSAISTQTAPSLESSTSASPMQRARATSFSSLTATSPTAGDVRDKLRRIELPLSPSPAASPPLSATAPLTPEILARFGLLLRFFQSPTCRLFSLCAWPISVYQRDLAAMCKGYSTALPVLRTLEALNAAHMKFTDMASLIRALQRALKKQSVRQLIRNGGALDQVFEDHTLIDAHPFSSPLIKEQRLRRDSSRAHWPCTPPTDAELEEMLDVCGGSLNRVSKVLALFLLEESPPRNAFRSVGELIVATRLLLAGKDVGTIGLGLDGIDPEMLDESSEEDSSSMATRDDSCGSIVDVEEYSLLQGLPALRAPVVTEPVHVSADATATTDVAPSPAASHGSFPRPSQASSRLDELVQCGQLELLGH